MVRVVRLVKDGTKINRGSILFVPRRAWIVDGRVRVTQRVTRRGTVAQHRSRRLPRRILRCSRVG